MRMVANDRIKMIRELNDTHHFVRAAITGTSVRRDSGEHCHPR